MRHRKITLFLLSGGLLICILFYLRIAVSTDTYYGSSDEYTVKLPLENQLTRDHAIVTDCDVVHVCFILEDQLAVSQVVAAIKTVLFHRYSPLHLHLILGASSRAIFHTLLVTWDLPSVEYSFYPKDAIVESIFDGNSVDLIKLALPYVLPSTVNKVVLLDNNVTLLKDIKKLWNHFVRIAKQNKLLGVSRDSSSRKGQISYNTNVILYNLEAMRRDNWIKMSQEAYQASPLVTVTAHTVINRMIEQHYFQYALPCEWNIKISLRFDREQCDADISAYSLLNWQHGITPYGVSNDSYVSYFTAMHLTLLEYDGNLLHDSPIRCVSSTEHKRSGNDEDSLLSFNTSLVCNAYREQAYLNYRVHLFFYGGNYHPLDGYDVTLVTQLSLDRLRVLKNLLRNWEGPISIAMYGEEYHTINLLMMLRTNFASRNNIIVHVVYKLGYLYPVNYLRNIALSRATTPYVFLCDGDFVPAKNLYVSLRNAAMSLTGSKTALVVPAFESLSPSVSFPETKVKLIEQLKKGIVRPFHPKWRHGHSATMFKRWYASRDSYRIKWEMYFEPYVLVPKDVTRYDRRFMGYGFNKASHIMKLKAQGYQFIVLPNSFVVHIPHQPTIVKQKGLIMLCVRNVFVTFVKELIVEYGEKSIEYNQRGYSSYDPVIKQINIFVDKRIRETVTVESQKKVFPGITTVKHNKHIESNQRNIGRSFPVDNLGRRIVPMSGLETVTNQRNQRSIGRSFPVDNLGRRIVPMSGLETVTNQRNQRNIGRSFPVDNLGRRIVPNGALDTKANQKRTAKGPVHAGQQRSREHVNLSGNQSLKHKHDRYNLAK